MDLHEVQVNPLKIIFYIFVPFLIFFLNHPKSLQISPIGDLFFQIWHFWILFFKFAPPVSFSGSRRWKQPPSNVV